MNVIDLCEKGLIPDSLSRWGMRQLMKKRLVDEANQDGEARSRRFKAFLDELRTGTFLRVFPTVYKGTHVARPEVHEVPVIGQPVPGGVLAHGGHHNAVGQLEGAAARAEFEFAEKCTHKSLQRYGVLNASLNWPGDLSWQRPDMASG